MILHDTVRFLNSCGPLQGSQGPPTHPPQQQQQPQSDPQLQQQLMYPSGAVINGQQTAVAATAALTAAAAANGTSVVAAALGTPAARAAGGGGGEVLAGRDAGPMAGNGEGGGAATLMQRLKALAVSVNEVPSLRHTAFMLLQVRAISMLRSALLIFTMESPSGNFSPRSQAWSDREIFLPRSTRDCNSGKDRILQSPGHRCSVLSSPAAILCT